MRWILIIFLSLSISSCQDRNKVPANILPPKKMQAVLWDMMRADKLASDFILRDTSLERDAESIKMYQEVLAIHSLSKEKFRESFNWYKDHPVVLKVIMDSINNRNREAPTQLATAPDSTSQQPQKIIPGDSSKPSRRLKPNIAE